MTMSTTATTPPSTSHSAVSIARILSSWLLRLSAPTTRWWPMPSMPDGVGEQLSSFRTPAQLDRDTIIYPKFNPEKCVGCGRCEISCNDGGHQAITFDAETRRPRLIGTKCVGCHLCRIVCPTGAIGVTKRTVKRK